MSTSYTEPVLAWYARNARDLPWRAPGATPWAVLVSEIMLQQTPVARVLPEYLAWIARWPAPAALAAEPAGEAIRQWGRLGYPRRALRLHETATILTARHGGTVPPGLDALLALPGVGSYTGAAVASFAFGQRHAVLDTNVRRVLARLVAGQPAAAAAPSVAERRLAESLLPAEPAVAARWSVAVMELGALVCTAASPSCGACPVAPSRSPDRPGRQHETRGPRCRGPRVSGCCQPMAEAVPPPSWIPEVPVELLTAPPLVATGTIATSGAGTSGTVSGLATPVKENVAVSPLPSVSTMTICPGRSSPNRIFSDRLSSISRWIVRRSGLAPRTGS